MMDKRKAQSIIIMIVALILAALFMLSIMKNYADDVGDNLYEASTQNLREVYGQLNQKFLTIVQMQWKQLEMTADFISEADNDVDKVSAYLGKWNEEWKYTEFYFFRDDSSYYRLDGASGYLMTGSAWKTLVLDRQNVVFDGSMPGGEALTFFAVPVEPSEIAGFKYCAVAIAYDTDALNRELGVTAYDKHSSSYMVYENGDIALKAIESIDIGSNVLYYLKKAEFKRGSHAEISQNVASGVAGQAECSIGGKDFYVAYQPVGVQDWTLISVVPVSVANSSTVNIQNATVHMLVSVFAVLAILAVIALALYLRHRAHQKDSELAWREMLSNVMVQNMDSVYLLWDMRTHKTRYVSPNVERILGISADINDHPLKKIVALEADKSTLWGMELQKIPYGSSIMCECWMTPLNGDKQPKLFQKTAYRVARGDDDMLIFEFADHSHEQSVRAQIQDALSAATEANHAKSDFLANMSHDIRTPMNAIIGIITLIDHDADSLEKVHEYVEKIKGSSQHLLSIINDVLDMSKIESGKTVLNIGEFNLHEIINEIENAFRPQSEARQQTFIIDVPEFKYPWLMGDNVRIMQILNNILSNAVKYTPVGGMISFSVDECPRKSRNYDKLVFRVSDNGIGMSSEFVEHIFESFTREERSVTNAVQGTGLGMAIVKNLVDLMGGAVHVESEQGKGSTFEVTLEFKIAERAQHEADSLPESGEKSNVSLEGIKFLCAEDNELNAEILTELLHMEGAECTICGNGKFVLDEFERSKPGQYDVILMDVQMPIMNGYEATRAIRAGKNPLGATIPIFAMTANAFSEDIQRSYEAGMDGHLSKPVDLDMLKNAIYSLHEVG